VEHAPTLVQDLAVVLGVAAITSVAFRLVRQPSILGYLLAGLIVGPYLPIPLFADAGRVQALSELGVVLVMFSVGLEFSFRRLLQLLPVSGSTALVQIGAMLWLGFTLGRLFGWSSVESLFLGAAISISSTMVVARVFDERKPNPRVRELVFGVLVIQDVAAIVLIAILTAVAHGAQPSTAALAATIGKLVVVLVAMIAVGILLVPRVVRRVDGLAAPETLLVVSIAVCFGMALLAEKLGYSVALGSFLAGILVSESGRVQKVEPLVHPLRDLFAAVFFVSVGMSVDPSVALAHAPTALIVAALVIVGQLGAVTLAGVLAGNPLPVSLGAGLSLGQIGEFAFIMAGIGAAAGVLDNAFTPIVITVAMLTAFTTPLLVRVSGRLAAAIDHRLPGGVRTFLSLYETWLDDVRRRRNEMKDRSRLRRLVVALVVDAAVATGVVIAASVWAPEAAAIVGKVAPERWAPTIVIVVASLAIAPFVLGLLRAARDVGATLALRVMPAAIEGKLDLGVAPRRVLTFALQLLVLLAVIGPVAAFTAPFLPGYAGLVFALVISVVALYFWRSAANFHGHVRAASKAIVELLAAQTADEEVDVGALFPGLEHVRPIRIEAKWFALDKTLGEVDLRARTGVSVLAIRRGESGVFAPGATDRLQVDDVVALAGSGDAIEHARALLHDGPSAVD
jgi:CPA2 family monovalent cation:H+ antiporter-2